MVRCLIVDDEPLAIDVLRHYITATPGLELVNAYLKPLDAFSFLQHQQVDLLFIDIQMPGLTGMELIKSLKHPPQVIFTTAYREYAVEGFELHALDYLVKPIARDRFLKAIDRYNGSLPANSTTKEEPAQQPFIFIKVDKEMVKLLLMDICFIEAMKNYVRIKVNNKEVISYHTLTYMEEKLPSHLFQRIHKSYLVNLSRIDKYTSESVETGGKLLPVGKMYQQELTKRLSNKVI